MTWREARARSNARDLAEFKIVHRLEQRTREAELLAYIAHLVHVGAKFDPPHPSPHKILTGENEDPRIAAFNMMLQAR